MRGVLVLFLLTQLLCGCVTMTQIRLDAEVDRRCREDGGLKVYETVPTPPEMFDQYGNPTFFDTAQKENALGPDYIFKRQARYLHGQARYINGMAFLGSPSLRRVQYQVLRRSDNKLLGESIQYYRYGGDPAWTKSLAPGAPESSYTCPETGTSPDTLVESIFINTAKRGVRP